MASSVDESEGSKPYTYPDGWQEIDGITYIPGTTSEFLQAITNLPVKGDEVFVAMYPKSDKLNTIEILWQIYNDGRIDQTPIEHRVPFLEFPMRLRSQLKVQELRESFDKHQLPRLFDTCLQYHLVPKGICPTAKPKYIYVMRNAKDCVVSYYHHYLSFEMFNFKRSWDEFFELFITDKAVFGSWFDHVLGWWAHRDDPNILFLKYEDMKKEPVVTVAKIARFVGKDIPQEMIQRIADQTTFDAMKDEEQFHYKSFISNGKETFFMKGQTGAWEGYFTEEQNRRFDEIYNKKMAGSGLEVL